MDSLIPFFDPIRGVTMPALVIKILLAVFFGGLKTNIRRLLRVCRKRKAVG